MKIQLGDIWPAGTWIYITDGRWFQATGEPTNDDGSSLRREDDELSESEANAQGIYRKESSHD